MIKGLFDKRMLKACTESIHLSNTGKRVVRHRAFKKVWEETILAVREENIFRLWGEALGSLLVYVEPGFDHIKYEGEGIYVAGLLTTAFIRFYAFNILQDCIDTSPIYRWLAETFFSKADIDEVKEEALRLSLKDGVDYNKVLDRLHLPVWNTFFPFSMIKSQQPNFRELTRLYVEDKKEFLRRLHSYVEDYSRDPIGRIAHEIYRRYLDPPEFAILCRINTLTNELAMINDFNRLVGKRYSRNVTQLLEILEKIDRITIISDSSWPWDILLDVTNKVM